MFRGSISFSLSDSGSNSDSSRLDKSELDISVTGSNSTVLIDSVITVSIRLACSDIVDIDKLGISGVTVSTTGSNSIVTDLIAFSFWLTFGELAELIRGDFCELILDFCLC